MKQRLRNDLVIHHTKYVVSNIELKKREILHQGGKKEHTNLRVPWKGAFQVPKPTIVHHLQVVNQTILVGTAAVYMTIAKKNSMNMAKTIIQKKHVV